MSGRDDLIQRAKERAETPPTPEEWGYRIQIEEGESFVGRWHIETADEDNNNRAIYLFWDESGEPCFHRHYASLARELTREQPSLGATIVVSRSENYKTQYDDEVETSGQSYGVASKSNDDPLPGEPTTTGETPAKSSAQLADDEEFPF
jgi:hypothetical protein